MLDFLNTKPLQLYKISTEGDSPNHYLITRVGFGDLENKDILTRFYHSLDCLEGAEPLTERSADLIPQKKLWAMEKS